mmetsp:Transcript_10180/g.10507  ORF Transcript_10180/g.10507 Transcript_10180/m.10507 type:complete len:114 (+) Transcript_10180:1-342(+)
MDFFWNLPIIRDIDVEALMIRLNEIDFEGQKKCETLYKQIVIFFLVIAIAVSFYTQVMSHGVYIIMLGTLVACLVCVPAWGCFSKHPLQWLQHEKATKKDLVGVSQEGAKKKE